MLLLRQSTAITVSFGPAVLNTDGVTLVTNLTGTGSNQTENTSTGIRLSKNGGAFAARHATAGASTYDAFGNYLVPLDTTDTNTLGTLRMQFADAAHFCPIFQDFMVINTALWDALCAASGGAIPNIAAGANNGLPLQGGAIPNANSNAAGGLPVSAAGALDLDEMNVDIEAIQTAIGAAGAGLTAIPDSTTITEINADVDELITTIGAAGAGLTAVPCNSGIRKNASLVDFEFLMTDSTNHNPATGKTVTVTRSVDNGSFVAGTLSAVTEIANGVYSVDFAAGDLNGRVITLRATATGCDDLLVTIVPDP